jgi:hypothetical protein
MAIVMYTITIDSSKSSAKIAFCLLDLFLVSSLVRRYLPVMMDLFAIRTDGNRLQIRSVLRYSQAYSTCCPVRSLLITVIDFYCFAGSYIVIYVSNLKIFTLICAALLTLVVETTPLTPGGATYRNLTHQSIARLLVSCRSSNGTFQTSGTILELTLKENLTAKCRYPAIKSSPTESRTPIYRGYSLKRFSYLEPFTSYSRLKTVYIISRLFRSLVSCLCSIHISSKLLLFRSY